MTTLQHPPTWLESYERLCAQRKPVVCPECAGDGLILTAPANIYQVPELDRCPICGGSGFIYEDIHAQAKTA